jgi:hypothetical protein
VETSKFVGHLAKASESNGPGMQRLAASLTAVQPEVRQAFAQYVTVAYQRSLLRRGVPPEPLATANHASAATSDATTSRLSAPPAAPSVYLEPVSPRRREAVYRR